MTAVSALHTDGGEAPDDGALATTPSPFVVQGESPAGVFAVVPAVDVALHVVDLPVRSDAQARRAAPFAIEDDIAVDPAEVHVAVGSVSEHGQRVLAVASNHNMQGWIASLPLSRTGATLIPEPIALAAATDTTVIVDLEATVITAFPDGSGFAVEADLFQRIGGEVYVDREIVDLTVYSDRPDVIVPQALPQNCEITRLPALSAEEYSTLIKAGASKSAFSLLQGPYTARMPLSESFNAWGSVLSVAAMALISYCLLLVSEAMFYSRAADDYAARTESVARQALPDVQRIVNPRTQVLARLNGLVGANQATFLQMSSAFYTALAEVPGSRLEALLYDASRGQISATISITAYQDIDTLRSSLSRRGLEFAEGASRTSGNRVVAEVMVRP